MALSDLAIKKAKPAPNPYKLADSGGLFLLVTPAGGKLWRLNYRHFSGEKTLSIGAYPTVTLEHGPFLWNRDSQISVDLIHPSCWAEASMNDSSLLG